MDGRKMRLLIALAVSLFLISGAVMLYPPVAAWYTERTRSVVHTKYQEIIDAAGTSVTDDIREAARRWNTDLFSRKFDPLDPENNGYYDQLNIGGAGIMGYIRIPKISVELPVYHGTSSTTLDRGAGHMPQSSLPIGGENTHAVISAHSGMAASPMFSDLSSLVFGDRFELEVLGELLTYEVDQILTVLPADIDAIQIERGQDLVTLITCVPFGVNTHRLLVRGHRVENAPNAEDPAGNRDTESDSEGGSVWLTEYTRSLLRGVLIGVLIALATAAFGVAIYFVVRKKKKEE